MTKKEETKLEAIKSAIEVAKEDGLWGVSLGKIGKRCGTSPRMLMYHFGNVDNMHREICDYAVENDEFDVIMQAVAMGSFKFGDLSDGQAVAVIDRFKCE